MSKTIADIAGTKDNYYDRTEQFAKDGWTFDKQLYIAGRILQAAELNEMQATTQSQLKSVADALFKDGDIVRDCSAIIENLVATIASGAIYLRGQVRGVPDGRVTVPATGTSILGIWLVPAVITSADYGLLVDPAAGNRGFNEQGAYRLTLTPQWGLATDNIQDAEFFPVYYVDDGQLRAKEPPPNLDAVTQAIARYDVDSNGSNYIINGMRVTRLEDGNNAQGIPCQFFSVDAGRARVNGFGIAQNSARRVEFPKDIPLTEVQSDPYALKTVNGVQRIDVRYSPLDTIKSLLVQKAETITMTRQAGGISDKFSSNTNVQVIVKVYAGATVYVAGTDFNFDPNNGSIDWIGTKIPADRGTYSVDCYHWVSMQPVSQDEEGFVVTGGVEATSTNPTTVRVTYTFRLPRIDRLVVNEEGQFIWIKGIASELNPASPPVPNSVLSICQIYQDWKAQVATGTGGIIQPDSTSIMNDGVRMVSMSTLEAMNNRLDDITDMIAQVNLVADINVRDAGIKKGLFVDPFTNNSQRDSGVTQELAIAGNCLQLPIAATVLEPTPASGATGVTDIVSCPFTDDIILSNTARTTSMKVNPYMAFDPPFPGSAVLTPQVDRWVDTNTVWVAPQTRYFVTTVYAPWSTQYGMHMTQNYTTGQNTVNELASSSTADAEYLRELDVHFTVSGFLAQEEVVMTFDGISLPVTP
ncbi:DUF4815 domain-containing protein [Salmonella enterica subsp. enterica serovar Mississippi]|nr:DUF4815 domain-containing protein [Salmonella enterica subsp. enterica serovar Mississippi]